MPRLPEWEQGTPGVLVASGPHAIPVSTAVRAGDDRLLFALGSERTMLARLREAPDGALCMLGAGVAFTAFGRASVIREPMECAPVTALELRVAEVQDHLADGRTEMLDGARWRWIDESAAEADPKIVAELRRMAEGDEAAPSP